jgi:glycosyltransferase involved in cell wall biosynthesis
MKIVLDARWIYREISGIGACTRELARHLPRLDESDEYVFLFNDELVRDRTRAEAGLSDLPNASTLTVGYGPFSPMNQAAMPPLLRSVGADVFHSTNYMIPLLPFPRGRRGRTAAVVTVHDVIPLLFRDHAPRSRKSRLFPLYRLLMIEVGRRANRIVTVSEASKRDLIREMRVRDPGKVRAIPNGVSELFLNAAPRPDRPPSRQPVILYVGRMDPYKNLEMLVRALDLLRRVHQVPATLKIVGPPDPRYTAADRLARDLGLADRVRWTGYLSDDALVDAYRQADILAHPSRYEGFGLQVIEAMAIGLPVVCTDAGALPEITGEAAIRTGPADTPGFAAALARVLTQPALARSMVEAGRRRAAAFTWRRAAAATIEVYRELAAEAGVK